MHNYINSWNIKQHGASVDGDLDAKMNYFMNANKALTFWEEEGNQSVPLF